MKCIVRHNPVSCFLYIPVRKINKLLLFSTRLSRSFTMTLYGTVTKKIDFLITNSEVFCNHLVQSFFQGTESPFLFKTTWSLHFFKTHGVKSSWGMSSSFVILCKVVDSIQINGRYVSELKNRQLCRRSREIRTIKSSLMISVHVLC